MSFEAIFKIAATVSGTGAVKDLEKAIRDASNSGNVLKRSFAGGALALKAFVAALPVAAFVGVVRSSVNLADNLKDISERTGIAVEELQKYKAVADLSGTSIDDVATSINKLNKTIVESRDGVGGASSAFKAMRINIEDANGNLKSSDQIINEIADRFKAFPDGPQKAALAMAVFGKSGANMIPVLNQGSEAIKRFNLGIDTEFAEKADRFNDSIDNIRHTFTRLGVDAGRQLLPVLTNISEIFNNSLMSASGSVTHLGEVFSDVFISIGRLLGNSLKGLKDFGAGVEAIYTHTKELLSGRPQSQIARNQLKYNLLQNQLEYAEFYADLVYGVDRGKKNNLSAQGANKKEIRNSMMAFKGMSDFGKESKDAKTGMADFFDEYIKNARDSAKQVKTVFENVFKSIENTMVDFFTTGKIGFKEMANSIIKDLLRVQIQKNILAPFAGALKSSSFFSSIASFAFADGGVMTGHGKVPLRKYAGGGIATSPQMSIYGEGSMPEAYVPLPDGRRIPVAMQGGGGTNVNVVVNMDGATTARGNNQSGLDLGNLIAGVVKNTLVNEKRPGGLLATA